VARGGVTGPDAGAFTGRFTPSAGAGGATGRGGGGGGASARRARALISSIELAMGLISPAWTSGTLTAVSTPREWATCAAE
jgi:hypothetical protein